ncbi:MFS transporter [Brachyspira murdochii]|uniref:Major facilitator superfamily MFS_1 n=1 Tax=Brachyspira murdochii (strain ATCC 51284 / DSM 12563 / 56-150) TaxID=526224 RepID=D5U7V7_BRAM5|nr:MFS transporter [Brachyspira murdochii]ADG72903.1 major facilitator superfamily MFS_1 [Brachyspira murdochii DSM 12563]
MKKQNNILVLILAFAIFAILNTEIGIVGVLPIIAETFNVTIEKSGILVSAFAFTIAISGIIMPLLFSGINKKISMLIVIGVFIISNIVSAFTNSFNILLIFRIIPAIFHPIYCSMSFTVASETAEEKDIPKVVSIIMMGVSAGIVIGTPASNFFAETYSYKASMLFAAALNIVSFIAIIFLVPSMPVSKKLSYGSQLSVLKLPITWISLAAVALIAASMSSVYSYFAQYIKDISNITGKYSSIILFIFGISSIVGNFLAGKFLSKNAIKFVTAYPFIFILIYILVFILGGISALMFTISFIWGIVYGMGNNIQQYWITSAIPQAPEFSNGLFISFGNLGITIGTSLGGLFITNTTINNLPICGIIFLILTFISIIIRLLIDKKYIKKSLA